MSQRKFSHPSKKEKKSETKTHLDILAFGKTAHILFVTFKFVIEKCFERRTKNVKISNKLGLLELARKVGNDPAWWKSVCLITCMICYGGF